MFRSISAVCSFIFFLTLPALAEQKTFGNPSATQGGTFTDNLQGEPATLNPIGVKDLYGKKVLILTMDSLMQRNLETYEWMPALAEKYETSADGKAFTFKLREGLKFHDGHPITAEDVKFSFNCIFDPKFDGAHWQPYFEGIDKVEVIDPKTVRFTTKEKYFGNFDVIAGDLLILPKHIYGDPKSGMKLNKTVIGSGAYKLESWDQGQSIVLTRNKDWWGNSSSSMKGVYNFEKIRLRFINSQTTALESLKKGDIDFQELTPEDYEKNAVGQEWGKSVFKVKTENSEPKKFYFIGLNERRELFKDREVRKALYHLFNRQDLLNKYTYGMSVLATGPWHQMSEYADPDVKPIEFDPKKAVELLKGAGWIDTDKDGLLDKTVDGKKMDFRFTLFYGSKEAEKLILPFQSDLKKYGIEMDLKMLEWNAFSKNLDEQTFDAVAMGWAGGAVDFDPKQVWHSSSAIKGGSNFIGYKNPEVDKLIDEARQEFSKPKRVKMYRKIYRLIADDVPSLFIFNQKYVTYGHSAPMKMIEPTLKYKIGSAETWWRQP
jgi:microcin C transport system substrate-binding protein